ncbi:MAG: AAA family ATPase [Bacilli bacterium]|nr:AAA family ATPase [Bacilli bacterium]MDD4407026.1 AAA family ATPase [Bacilli bacterium]
MSKGVISAVYSAKGGVGKTTFTLNLAGTLCNNKKKVLIVDLDLYSGAIAISLNKIPIKTIYHFHNDLNKKNDIDIFNYITKYNNYIDFISCPKDIKEVKSIDYNTIEKLVFKASLLYDVILFDLSHIYSEINCNILNMATNILYLFTNDPADLKNTANVLNILKQNNNNLNVILNYSINPERNYYVLYDIKHIINNNIDYIISNRFYNPQIDNITIRGEIFTINNQKHQDYKILNLIAKSIL